jgi:hypothetical protein
MYVNGTLKSMMNKGVLITGITELMRVLNNYFVFDIYPYTMDGLKH